MIACGAGEGGARGQVDARTRVQTIAGGLLNVERQRKSTLKRERGCTQTADGDGVVAVITSQFYGNIRLSPLLPRCGQLPTKLLKTRNINIFLLKTTLACIHHTNREALITHRSRRTNVTNKILVCCV